MIHSKMIFFSPIRALLACAILMPVFSPAQTAQPDNSIRVSLESTYAAWGESIMAADLGKWEEATAFSRQIETRNRILSQKLPFPQALFDDPVEAPSLGGLISLGVLSTGETATSTYFGKANFGSEPGVAITDNLLVLHFLKEEGRWKFDSLRVVKIGNDGELLLQIRNRDFSFLQGQEFQPAAQLPPVPQPVEMPEMIAEVWIDATGYEVKVTVNGHPSGTFSNIKAPDLVMGGVHRGQNSIKIETRLLEKTTGTSPSIEVAIYAAKDPAGQAQRVYHYRPGASVVPLVSENFNVE